MLSILSGINKCNLNLQTMCALHLNTNHTTTSKILELTANPGNLLGLNKAFLELMQSQ